MNSGSWTVPQALETLALRAMLKLWPVSIVGQSAAVSQFGMPYQTFATHYSPPPEETVASLDEPWLVDAVQQFLAALQDLTDQPVPQVPVIRLLPFAEIVEVGAVKQIHLRCRLHFLSRQKAALALTR